MNGRSGGLFAFLFADVFDDQLDLGSQVLIFAELIFYHTFGMDHGGVVLAVKIEGDIL